MSDVVFPSRPGSHGGIRTPGLPNTPDATPVSGRQQQAAAEVEVVVLKPSIRPPSYDEVVAANSSPSRFGSGSPASWPSSSRRPLGANSSHVAAAVAASPISDRRALPSPVHTPGVNTTFGAAGGTAQKQGNGGDRQNDSNIAASNNKSNNHLNNSNFSDEQTLTRRPQNDVSPRRQLACWYADRKKGDAAIPTLRYRTIGDTVKGCLATNDARPLTGRELQVDWKRICALRSGKEIYKFRPPYVERDEFADPLRNTSGDGQSKESKVLIPCGYVRKERKGENKWDVIPTGYRPTARENVQVALKPTEVDPLEEKTTLQGSPMRAGGGGESHQQHQHQPLAIKDHHSHSASHRGSKIFDTGAPKITDTTAAGRALREAAAVPLNRPPTNPTIEEADRRLQQNGFGGLATVSRASDEAVSHLLKFCGFSDAERLAVLWEIRKSNNALTKVL